MAIHAGENFGRLTAVRATDRKHYWLFQCECGNEHIARFYEVKSGRTKSCGCLKYSTGIRLIQSGDIFGHLTAIRLIENTRWLFKCVCGKEHAVDSASVKGGHTKSCGCRGWIKGRCRTCLLEKPKAAFSAYGRVCKECTKHRLKEKYLTDPAFVKRQQKRNKRRYERNKSNPLYVEKERQKGFENRKTKSGRIRTMFQALRRGARMREIPFILLVSDIEAKFEQQNWKCARTGIQFELTAGEGRKPFAPSVDRIDNSRGYEPGNIQIVIWMYNIAKNKFTDADVLAFATATVENAQRSLQNRLKNRG